MPDKFQYFVTNLSETRQVYPAGKPKIVWNKNSEDFRYDYEVNITNEFIFTGNDFKWFLEIENSENRCVYAPISISKLCSGEYIEDWQKGRLSMNAGKWDLDNCRVAFTVDQQNKFICYDEGKEEEINLLEAVAEKVTADLMEDGEIEFAECIYESTTPTTDPCPDGEAWTIYRNYVAWGDPINPHQTIYYARWHMTDGSYKPVMVYNRQDLIDPTTQNVNQVWSIGGYQGSGTIDNGMKLQDAMQMLIEHACQGLTLKSDFFQWNPDIPTNTNYVTGEASQVMNLVLFQKSDAKRPWQDNASIANCDLEKLLTGICTMFNLRWDIDDVNGLFIIEHLSFFSANAGLDLTLPKYNTSPNNWMRRMNRYSYKRDEMPKFEKFFFMEAQNADFLGGYLDFNNITYSGACISSAKDGNTKEYKTDIITTDLTFILNNPADDQDQNNSGSLRVSDDGFALLACDANNHVINLPGILDQDSANNSLSWSYLFERYHRHGRVLMSGIMNKVQTDFLSVIKTKQQTPLRILFCCEDDQFNPQDLITTGLGTDGEVNSATLDLYSGMLDLNISFSAE